MTKKELFLELATPNEDGFSRAVSIMEFVGNYRSLKLGNGGSWCRASSSIAKDFKLEFDKTVTRGNSIDTIKLVGENKDFHFKQQIRADIRSFYKGKNCVMLGVNGNSGNTKVELDHKDGRKNNERVSNTDTQLVSDFQPLSKAANDIKRQICKVCKETDVRWSAMNIEGNFHKFYKGTEKYTADLGCIGCYQYDPVEYRRFYRGVSV